ncbi:unnamed protein product [Phytophthora lilii]|uniref:Unnamed protein product n=1 Tax=Phytophthora lilii TaxID=2077276 RepID=A0A9W6TVX4_9STRA|nr:unnamed protein product [Phytophthora lilii]
MLRRSTTRRRKQRRGSNGTRRRRTGSVAVGFDGGGLVAERAVLAGQTHVVRWMYKTDELEDRNDYATMDAALATGNMELLRWVMHLTKISPEGHEGLYGAAARGLVGPLQFLQDRGEYKKFDAGTLIKAAEAGHMNVVHWIMNRDRNDEGLGDESGEDEYRTFERRPEDRKTHLTCLEGEASLAIHAAAINGHLNIAKYLYALVNMPRDRGDRIKENQRLKNRGALLRFVSGSAQKVSGKTMIRAAEKGFLDVVEWLYDEFNGDPTINLFWVDGYFDEEFGYNESEVGYDEQVFCSVVDAAAANGHLDVVQFLLQVAAEERTSKRRRVASYSCPQSEEVPDIPTKPGCTVAAINGAAAHGHLDVVRWLHANRTEGCTTTAMDLAAQNGHLEMVQWLHNNRSEGCTTSAMDMAARGGHLDVIKWLHGHRIEGCTTKAMNNAAATGHLEVVKWLHEHRSEGCTAAAMDGAAAYGELDVVKWLHRHRSAGCTERAMDNAAHGGHLPVLRWLHDNRSDGFTTNAMDNAARFGNFETVLILHNLAQEGLGRDIEILDEDGSEQWVLSKYQEAIASQLPLEQSDARWESTMDVSLYHQRP